MSTMDDTSEWSNSSQSANFSFGMNEFEEFDSDSENEGDNIVAESNFFDLGGHSNNVLEEMEYLTLYCDSYNYNQTHTSVAGCDNSETISPSSGNAEVVPVRIDRKLNSEESPNELACDNEVSLSSEES